MLKMAVSEKCVFDLPFLVGLFPSTVKLIQNSEHNVCQVFLVGNDNASEEAEQSSCLAVHPVAETALYLALSIQIYIQRTRFTF